MKLINYKLLKSALIALFTLVIFAGCEDDDDVTVVGETSEKIINDRTDMTIFKAALEKTRLNSFTKGGGPFTIWAPTNAAFNAVGINSAADLALIDSNALVQILTYHIQPVNRSFTEIPLGPNATMNTQGGFTQYASRKPGGSAYINGVQVIEPNIKASNGFVHVINRLLVPPFFTTTQVLASTSNYARFYQAVLRTATSTTTNPLTILAVDNAVMVAAGYDSTAIANATGTALTTLTAVIKHHFINKRIFSSDFVTGNLKTVQGTNVLISGNIGAFSVKGINNAAPFMIKGLDIVTTTGVIQSINGLLKP